MKAFSLKEYLKNPERKVVTRDGRGVRIRCTDRRGGDYPIVALVETSTRKSENVLSYREDGKWSPADGPVVESNLDLFFAPEKHERWANVYLNSRGDVYFGQVHFSEEEAKNVINPLDTYIKTIKIEWEE